jgi:hypothetical protein
MVRAAVTTVGRPVTWATTRRPVRPARAMVRATSVTSAATTTSSGARPPTPKVAAGKLGSAGVTRSPRMDARRATSRSVVLSRLAVIISGLRWVDLVVTRSSDRRALKAD